MSSKLQLLREERDLILKHGYPFEPLAKALQRWPANAVYKRILISDFDLNMLIGELCRTINHAEAGEDEDELIELCDRLEYFERTGDGDLDILM